MYSSLQSDDAEQQLQLQQQDHDHDQEESHSQRNHQAASSSQSAVPVNVIITSAYNDHSKLNSSNQPSINVENSYKSESASDKKQAVGFQITDDDNTVEHDDGMIALGMRHNTRFKT